MNNTCIFMKLYINICLNPSLDQSVSLLLVPSTLLILQAQEQLFPPALCPCPGPAVPKHFLLPWNLLEIKLVPNPSSSREDFPAHLCSHTVTILLALQSKPLIFLSLPPALSWAVLSDISLCLPKTADHQQWWQQQKCQELILPLLSRAGPTLSC